jgi:hypothetical protein
VGNVGMMAEMLEEHSKMKIGEFCSDNSFTQNMVAFIVSVILYRV